MSRKEPSFAQLYDYITREGDYDGAFSYSQNFILRTRESILEEFNRNSKLLARRSNWNYLYHEIISITRASKLDEQKQKEILRDIVNQYSKSRGRDCLVFGGLHDEKDNNLHFHLMISANQVNDSKRLSLKKAEFNAIKKQIEHYTLEKYPELEQAQLITKNNRDSSKDSQKEQELKKRTGSPSQRDIFRDKLKHIFDISENKEIFFDHLKAENIEIYTRGKTIWFIDLEHKRKHRLKTLGLEDEFNRVSNAITQKEEAREIDKPLEYWTVIVPVDDLEDRRDEIRETRTKLKMAIEKEPLNKDLNPVRTLFDNVLESIHKILPFLSNKISKRRKEIRQARKGKGEEKGRFKDYN